MRNPSVISSSKTVLTKQELEAFDKMSKEIINTACTLNKNMIQEESGKSSGASKFMESWLRKVMRRNVLGGKMLRGLMVPIATKSFLKSSLPEELLKKMRLAYALGWILEILQAASLIADDIMDNSETRRGKLCWYRQPNIGLTAVNDSFLLETVAFQLLKVYFEKEPYYRELYRALHNIIFYTVHGQSLDCHTESSVENIIDCYTKERYDSIVKYKTSYYTTFMPVICAMILARKTSDKDLVYQVEQIMLQIGHYFQVQDDYLDCFGDFEKTGKIGTDIQDNKCSWLFIKAVELCSDRQEKEILVENYGKRDKVCVENVKKLYVQLGVKEAYENYEERTYAEVIKKLNNLPKDMPHDLFLDLLRKLYKRNV